MAALAIDVSALYVARSEAQRAANAAALAGARIFATSSFTSVPASFSVPSQVCGTGAGSSAAVNKLAVAAALQNSVSNQPATITSLACDLSQDGNPQVMVTVKQNNVQGFLSRIWSSANVSVSATATAEAYNASEHAVQIQASGVKPWLLANCDETNTTTNPNPNCAKTGGGFFGTFVNSDGTLSNNGSYIGHVVPLRKMNSADTPNADTFYALDLGAPAVACPTTGSPCSYDGGYRDDIQCSSPVKLSCGQTVGGSSGISVIGAGGYGAPTRQATQCLIHSNGDDDLFDGQDIFHVPGSRVPIRIEGGDDNPNPPLRSDQNISASSSVVTVPLYNGRNMCPGGVCNDSETIVGFMQLGIRRTCSNGGSGCASPLTGATGTLHLEAVILNAVACSSTGGGVSAGGSSPIAVRLIHQ
jgi:hypothetical protein